MKQGSQYAHQRKSQIIEEKKRDYIHMLHMEHQEFLQRRHPSQATYQNDEPAGCCFSFFSSKRTGRRSKKQQHSMKQARQKSVEAKGQLLVNGQHYQDEETTAAGEVVQQDAAQQQQQSKEDHGFSTSLSSSEWLDYICSQLEQNLQSSSVSLLGFNWAKELLEFIEDEEDSRALFCNVQKYRSAIFYLNYSVRQIRIDSDLDVLIRRKQTQLQKKLRKLDNYPKAQDFINPEMISNHNEQGTQRNKDSMTTDSHHQHRNPPEQQQHLLNPTTLTTGGNTLSPPPESFQPSPPLLMASPATAATPQSEGTIKKSEPPSMLSFIYDEVTQRVKNIEDFGAPLGQLDRVLHSLLVQLRSNLNEADHPLNVIVGKFQKVILEKVEEVRDKYRQTMQGQQSSQRTQSKPQVIDINGTNFNEEEKKFCEDRSAYQNPSVIGGVNDTSQQAQQEKQQQLQATAQFKMPEKGTARQTALLNLRCTYNRQTLNQLPQQAQFAEVVIAEVKKFVCVLYGAVVRLYIPVLRYEDLHEMREDLIEMLTSLTVKGDLAHLLLQLCRLGTREDEAMLSQRFEEFRGVRPEQIGIDKLFTLNDASKLIDMYQEQLDAMNEKFGDVGGSEIVEQRTRQQSASIACIIQENNPDDEPQTTTPQGRRESKSLLLLQSKYKDKKEEEYETPKLPLEKQEPEQEQPKKSSGVFSQAPITLTKEFIKMKLKMKPYMMAIENLRKVRDFETPIDKMRCITQTSRCIVACIDQFWSGIPQIDKKKLTLDADQLLMIFIFVTLRSKVFELLAHIKFINEFSTNTLRLSKLGYCILTLEVAVQQIVGLESPLQMSKSIHGNAEALLEKTLKASLQSEYPLMAADDVFDYVQNQTRDPGETLQELEKSFQDEVLNNTSQGKIKFKRSTQQKV